MKYVKISVLAMLLLAGILSGLYLHYQKQERHESEIHAMHIEVFNYADRTIPQLRAEAGRLSAPYYLRLERDYAGDLVYHTGIDTPIENHIKVIKKVTFEQDEIVSKPMIEQYEYLLDKTPAFEITSLEIAIRSLQKAEAMFHFKGVPLEYSLEEAKEAFKEAKEQAEKALAAARAYGLV